VKIIIQYEGETVRFGGGGGMGENLMLIAELIEEAAEGRTD